MIITRTKYSKILQLKHIQKFRFINTLKRKPHYKRRFYVSDSSSFTLDRRRGNIGKLSHRAIFEFYNQNNT